MNLRRMCCCDTSSWINRLLVAALACCLTVGAVSLPPYQKNRVESPADESDLASQNANVVVETDTVHGNHDAVAESASPNDDITKRNVELTRWDDDDMTRWGHDLVRSLRQNRLPTRSLGGHSRACPLASDGMEKVPCPRHAGSINVMCIDDHQLCDGHRDCSDGKDEDKTMCLFYKLIKSRLDILYDRFVSDN